MCGVFHGSFSLQDHLDPLRQLASQKLRGAWAKLGGGRKHRNVGMMRQTRHPSLGTPPHKI